MVQRNPHMAKLQAGYLFPEIARRRRAVAEKNPTAKIISLGIGDTTEPLPPFITSGLVEACQGMGTLAGYSGYGAEQGMADLRERIAERLYGGIVKAGEVFVSDGAKCDTGRLQVMFGAAATVAVQDPSYPVYVDGSVILGQTGGYNAQNTRFDGIEYMRCDDSNNFFPDLGSLKRTDLIYFCSPNNPTGAVATRDQLAKLVSFARRNRSIILYDAAYSAFIENPNLPRSIFEIEGSREVALEINSFSKVAGFTGVRLGWTVVPEELKFEDGTPVSKDWNRIVTTLFNGASNIVQKGGMACLSDEGYREVQEMIQYYKTNARIIKSALSEIGLEVYGGVDSPYCWARMKGKGSWEAFEEILNEAFVVTTPGAGFGPAGEGFLRFSSFGHRADVEEAVERLKKHFG